jgi:citrate lyase subunit beta/citryl-CoA lyase
MPAVFRPRRSLIYLPGSNPQALEKARSLPADGLIIDLEDAVAADAKEAARAIVSAALAAGGYGSPELVLRVNPLDTPWGHADLAAAATMPIDAVLLPKVESPDQVRLTLSLLDALGAPEQLAVLCMIETPLGVLAAREIAAASPRLEALVLGTSDLTKELHALVTRDRLPLITRSAWRCLPPGLMGSRSSTASISICPMRRASLYPAGRAASWALTARR